MTPASTAPANWCPVCRREKKRSDPHEACKAQAAGPKLFGDGVDNRPKMRYTSQY